MKLIIDIETIPDENVEKPKFDESSVRVGNLKDEAKIKAKIEEEKSKYNDGLTKKMSLSSNYARILSLGYILFTGDNSIKDKAVVYGENSDIDILHHLQKIYYENDIQLVIGWNCKNFDIPVLWKRYVLNKMICPFNYMIYLSKYNTTHCLDLMYVWNAYDYGKLKDCCDRLDIKSKSGMDGSMIYDAWKDGKQREICEYNMEDCLSTLEIYKRLNI